MKTIRLLMFVALFPALLHASDGFRTDGPRDLVGPAEFMDPPEPVFEPFGAVPQGPLAGAQVAVIENMQGDVRVARAAARATLVRINASGLPLANGDIVQTLQGRADIRFTDQSIITLDYGTIVTITERQVPEGFSARSSR